MRVLPKLVKLSSSLDGLWDPDMNAGEFAARVVSVFQQESAVFCEEDEMGFKYAAILHKDDAECWYFWLFYVNVKYRDLTRAILADIKQFCADRGIKKLRFSTTRTTRSYERWVTKFGATKHAIVYQLQLNNG